MVVIIYLSVVGMNNKTGNTLCDWKKSWMVTCLERRVRLSAGAHHSSLAWSRRQALRALMSHFLVTTGLCASGHPVACVVVDGLILRRAVR